jgi:exopolysaccharide biosynthesis polyprenyl glycosylphosphotransferase
MIRLFNVSLPGRTVLLALSDVFVVFAALLGALLVWARSGSAWMPYGTSLAQIGVISLIWMPCIYYYDLYDTSVLSSISDGMTRLLQVVGTACLALAVLYALFPEVGLSHSLLITWALLAGALLGAVRWIFSAISSAGTWSEGVVLFGDGPLAQQLSKEIGARPELGLRILGSVGIDDTAEGLKNLGGLEDLANVVQREKARHIVLTLTDRRGFMPIDDLLRLRSRGVDIQDGVSLYEEITGKLHLETLRPSTLLFARGFRGSLLGSFVSRVIGFVVASIALLLVAPFIAIIALVIRLDSPGPVFFLQKRVGKDGKVFLLYKLRSMFWDVTDSSGSLPAEASDRRITRVGRWLRQFRLDELPQLYNIAKGDMCFIGPRPFTCEMEEDLSARIPFYSQRWTVRPGATGWAQVHSGYCVTLEDNIEKLSHDLYYIKNRSLGLDCLIFLKTVKILLLGKER